MIWRSFPADTDCAPIPSSPSDITQTSSCAASCQASQSAGYVRNVTENGESWAALKYYLAAEDMLTLPLPYPLAQPNLRLVRPTRHARAHLRRMQLRDIWRSLHRLRLPGNQ
jgi:hypothetical protein